MLEIMTRAVYRRAEPGEEPGHLIEAEYQAVPDAVIRQAIVEAAVETAEAAADAAGAELIRDAYAACCGGAVQC